MVVISIGVIDRPPIADPCDAAAAPTERTVPPASRAFQLSRVEGIRRLTETNGVSKEASDLAANSIRESSSNVYNSRWKIFCDWCEGRSVDPLQTTVALATDFLLHLRNDRQLAVGTIRGYVASVSSVLKYSTSNPLNDMIVSNILKGMEQLSDRAQLVARRPKWDLPVVLKYLSSDIFTSESVPLRLITLKTVFLVAISTGCRSSELHAISSDVQITATHAILKTKPGFITKTQKPSDAVQGMCFSLKRLDSSDLCPVTWLEKYLRHVRPFKSQSLWVNYTERHNDISKATVATWICTVVKSAYAHFGNEMPEQINAHEVRAICSSLYVRQQGVDQVQAILNCGLWKSKHSFLNHYVRDVDHWKSQFEHFDMEVLGAQINNC